MVVGDAVQVIVATHVIDNAVRVEEEIRTHFRCHARASVINIHRMAGVVLKEATHRPASKCMAYKTPLGLEEWKFVRHAEFIRVPVIKRTWAVQLFRVAVCNVIVGCCGTD